MSALPALRSLSDDVHAISFPARTFTGDFYFTHRHADRLWFALGDVAGKGLPAALVMAMIQEELEERITSCAETECYPAATMLRLHEFLHPLLPRNRFATVVIGWLDDDGTLRVANAGHCPPLLVRGSSVEQIASTGPVAGILPAARWQSFTTTLGAGDSLVLYSDGVLEAESADGEEFGLCALRRAVRGGGDARQVVSRVLTAVNAHAPEKGDDLTIMVVRR